MDSFNNSERQREKYNSQGLFNKQSASGAFIKADQSKSQSDSEQMQNAPNVEITSVEPPKIASAKTLEPERTSNSIAEDPTGKASREKYKHISIYSAFPSGNDPSYLTCMPPLNWGAFGFSWLWLFFNVNKLWGLISGLAILILSLLGCYPLTLVINLYLLYKGNELTWKYKKYENYIEFKNLQRTWNTYFFIIAGTIVILNFIYRILGIIGIIEISRL